MTTLTKLPDVFERYLNNTVGFDRLFDQLTAPANYPPHNIAKINDHQYIIELAIAGFHEEDLEIELKDQTLTISGKISGVNSHEPIEYYWRGIATREFRKAFKLAERVEVKKAEIENGLLRIHLEHIIPESQKPKLIAITKS